jgi:hypothetical protein
VSDDGERLIIKGGLYFHAPTPGQKAELEAALANARPEGYLVIPTGVDRETLLKTPAVQELLRDVRSALADAVGSLSVAELLPGMSGEARQVCAARDRVAVLVRSAGTVPLVDQWGNVVGHRFREAP